MDAFNAVLLHISDELNVNDLEKIKFLSQKEIGKKKLEEIHSGTQLFKLLMERNKIGPHNTEFLSFLLQNIGRQDLLDSINNFERYGTGSLDEQPDAKEQEKLDIATTVIAENLGKKWLMYGRKLGLTDAKLDHIREKHPFNLEEQVVELLREWRKMHKAKAKAAHLIEALRSCNQNYTADLVEKELYER